MLNLSLLNPVLLSIANAYRKQLIKYKVMLKLTYKQKEYTEKYEMDRLREILEARQRIIKELEEINRGIRPLREEVTKVLGLRDFSSRAILEVVPTQAAIELTDVLSKIGDVLYKIKEMDQANEDLLRKSLTSVNKKLTAVKNKQDAINAYKRFNNK